jgi:site-specific DNA-methyltransferase (adenine-specific)
MTPYYQHGDVTIYHGDCLEVLHDTTGLAYDLIITSPPYNCGKAYGAHDDAMDAKDYFSWFEDRYHAMASSLLAGGYCCVNAPTWMGSRADRLFAFDEFKPLADRHLRFHDLIIWDKGPPNGMAWGNHPNAPFIRANHEWVFVHRAEGPPRGDSDISWAEWSRLTQSVWSIQTTLPHREQHPATFPYELPRRLVMLFSAPGATVCDPFMGTGTTLVAAKRLGRKAIGIDREERYCEMAAMALRQDSLPLG